MTLTDEYVLVQQDDATLAKWWSVMNCGKWPKDITPYPPPTYWRMDDRRLEIMSWIAHVVGLWACLHEWYCGPLSPHPMTEDEFDDFWRGTFEGDEGARERHQTRTREKIAGRRKP